MNRYASRPRTWVRLLLALVATALLAPAVLGPVEVFDEGFIASGAMMILRGSIPVRDFFVIYGPGQYYLSASVFAVFGEDLLVTRLLHLGVLGGLLAMVSALAQRLTGGQLRVAALALLAAWPVVWIANVAAGYAALPATLLLLAACPWIASAALGAGIRSALAGSALIGLAGLFRWDFGLYGAVAAVLAVLAIGFGRGMSWPQQMRSLGGLLLPVSVILGIGFVPFILVGDAGRWWTEVPVFHALEFKTWRNLEFLTPAWGDLKAARSAWDASRAAARVSFAMLPVLAALVALALALPRCWRERSAASTADAVAVVLALLTLMLFNQMRVRSHWPQGLPAYLCAVPLLAYTLHAAFTRPGLKTVAWAWGAALCVSALAVPVYVAQGEIRTAGLPQPAEPANSRARGVLLPPRAQAQQRWRDYQALIRHLQSNTAPDEPIFSGVTDTSRLFVNDALLYFLARRPAATRWIEMEPGLTSGERGQREVASELERQRVRLIVLADITSREPNATGRSNGVTALDDYIRARYSPGEQFGSYRIWVRRGD